MRTKLREIAEQAKFDPAGAIHKALGDDIKEVEIFGNKVLVATYIGPDRSAGGILYTDKRLAEDRFQGKLFLVLAVGPLAFKDDSVAQFGGKIVNPGDWIIANPSDGYELFKVDKAEGTGTCCRIFEDTQIKGRVSDPALIF